jgi:D-alanyl-D-alanine carboxypeptidase
MRKSSFQIILSFLLLFYISSTAQKIQSIQEIKKEIDKYIKAEMKVEQIPGLTYAIIRNGKIIDSGAYGLANVELKAPVNMHSLFSIGSIGKTFTSTAIMLLQKDGKLSLTDPIMKYLDSLPETWKNITIRHLLTHTSGIKDYAHDFPGYPFIEKDRKQEYTESQFIQMAAKLPLNFDPGERWAYSNSNFVLLGFIIHKVSGKTLPEFMKEKIFGPLGMKDTRYINVREVIVNRATGYLLDDDNRFVPGLYVSNFFSTTGDMGIITTARDMAKWSIALDNEKILDKQILKEMWTPVKLNNGLEGVGILGVNYGLGWGISNHRGYDEIGHSGSFINGYTANFIRFDDLHFAVIVLCNLNPSNVHWISYNLAGFFVPGLKGIDQLKTEENPDTSFNQKIYTLLDGIGNDNLDTSLVTESFKQRINPITKIIFKPDASANTSISFVSSDKMINRNLKRYEIPIQKINYYKINIRNETHYLAIYITSNNKIADVRGY